MKQNSIQSSEAECNSCGNQNFSLIIDAYDFDTGNEKFSLIRCSSCGLVRTSPLLSDSLLGNYYKTDYYGKGEQKFSPFIEKWTIFNNLKLAKSISHQLGNTRHENGRTPRVLDIGCGRGNLLKAFNQLGFECHGIERTEFPGQHDSKAINIYKTSIQESKFDDNYFDVIILWHVLEHLSNPADTIKEINRTLSPSGILIIAVPNFGSLQSRLFGKHWFHLDLPRHLYHFDYFSLHNMLEKNNFKITKYDTRAIDQSIFGFIQSALNRIHWLQPNSFYEQLKQSWSDRRLSFYVQGILAGILLPFSLIDYIVSGLSHKGSCLILTCCKQNDNAE